jgi:hypothetical protein
MRGFLIGLLVLIVVVVGGGAIASTAYQAGLSQAVTTVAQGAAGAAGTTGTTVVVPAYGYGYGWHGFGWGFGFFGFFGFLLVLFLVFGLIRAIAFGGRGGWGRGWKGGGRWDGPGDHRHPFESRAREVFTELHREAHEGPSDKPAAPADSTEPRTPSA